jgi:hypothetical protein
MLREVEGAEPGMSRFKEVGNTTQEKAPEGNIKSSQSLVSLITGVIKKG